MCEAITATSRQRERDGKGCCSWGKEWSKPTKRQLGPNTRRCFGQHTVRSEEQEYTLPFLSTHTHPRRGSRSFCFFDASQRLQAKTLHSSPIRSELRLAKEIGSQLNVSLETVQEGEEEDSAADGEDTDGKGVAGARKSGSGDGRRGGRGGHGTRASTTPARQVCCVCMCSFLQQIQAASTTENHPFNVDV